MEPADLWVERLPAFLRDDAPRVLKNEGRPGYSFHAPGLVPSPVAGAWASGKSGAELKEHLERAGYETARPSGWDPVERVKDQEIDGVLAEVLYGTLGMRLFPLLDAAMQRAVFGSYNDWLAEYCSYDPKRLHGIGLISLWDVDLGVEELERCAAMGCKGGMIWGCPPADRPYHSRMYDRLWAAAQDLRLPLSMHIVTGMGEESRVDFSDAPMRYVRLIHEIQRSLSSLILGGVLERFPDLVIVCAESDIGWLPHFMQRMDHANMRFGAMMEQPLSIEPSDYVRRQVRLTFMDDPVGVATYDRVGRETYMWGSDFPHTDSTWPNSRKVIERNFEEIPDEVAEEILFDNATRLYHIDLDGVGGPS
jgi:predicted TIM-barrel fold metal-dependent hydrolase